MPPINYVENGVLKGFSIDIINEIQRRLGTSEPIHPVPWARGNKMVQLRKKTILVTLTPSDDRKKVLYYLGPIAVTEVGFFSTEDFKGEVKDLNDLINEKVAVRGGTHTERLLQKRNFTKLQPTGSIAQNVQMVRTGRAKFLADTTVQTLGTVELYGLPPLRKVYVLEKTNLYIVFSKDTSQKVLNEWKKALTDMKEDGTFLRIHKKWIPDVPAPMQVELLEA